MGGVVPEIVPALALGEGHGVRQAHLARIGREDRLDHERAGQVAPLGRVVRGRANRPVARVRVQQPGEDRVAVVARQAEPVDGAVAVREGRGVAVGKQAVVRDWLGGLLAGCVGGRGRVIADVSMRPKSGSRAIALHRPA